MDMSSHAVKAFPRRLSQNRGQWQQTLQVIGLSRSLQIKLLTISAPFEFVNHLEMLSNESVLGQCTGRAAGSVGHF